MDKNKKFELSEEQLAAVAGGSGVGTFDNPIYTDQCWFVADGEPENGRTKCKRECKEKSVYSGSLGPKDIELWFVCRCWCSSYCIDRLHAQCRNPKRH